jgi:hypothetical protein
MPRTTDILQVRNGLQFIRDHGCGGVHLLEKTVKRVEAFGWLSLVLISLSLSMNCFILWSLYR